MLSKRRNRRLIMKAKKAFDNCKSTNNKFQQSVLILKKSTKTNKTKSESKESNAHFSQRHMRIIYSMSAYAEATERSKRFVILNASVDRRLLLVSLQSLSKKGEHHAVQSTI